MSQLQPRPGLRPLWWRRKSLVLQLFFLQQEVEENRFLHMSLCQVSSSLLFFFNLLYNKASTLTPGHIDVVDKLQRPERLRPWQSGQRAGHGAGRWGGVGRLHWGQVRPRTTGLLPHFYPFKNYTKMIFFFLFFSQVPQSSVCVTESRCPSQPPVWTSPPPCFHFITPCVLKVICFFKDVVASSWSHVSHL